MFAGVSWSSFTGVDHEAIKIRWWSREEDSGVQQETCASPGCFGTWESTVHSWRLGLCLCSCVHAQSHQSCPTLCDPMDCSPLGSWVHGILQVRLLEWVAMPSSSDISNPGIEPESFAAPTPAGTFFTTEPLGKLRVHVPPSPNSHSCSIPWEAAQTGGSYQLDASWLQATETILGWYNYTGHFPLFIWLAVFLNMAAGANMVFFLQLWASHPLPD